MKHYIDGFVLPIPSDQLSVYKEVVKKVAEIWKEYGALNYSEYVCDDFSLEGTKSFAEITNANKNESIIFGWVVFESREARDLANKKVAEDPRMADLINPLTNKSNPIFDAERMVFGGFKPLF